MKSKKDVEKKIKKLEKLSVKSLSDLKGGINDSQLNPNPKSRFTIYF